MHPNSSKIKAYEQSIGGSTAPSAEGQRDFLHALASKMGGVPSLAGALVRGRRPLDPHRIYVWVKRGVPLSYRPALVLLAQRHGVEVPPGFMGGFARADLPNGERARG